MNKKRMNKEIYCPDCGAPMEYLNETWICVSCDKMKDDEMKEDEKR